MTTTSIPPWNSQGVLPPVNPADRTSAARSPYVVGIVDVVLRYSTTPERRAILDGLLRYRSALHEAGLVEGFQWLDGSFFEQVEVLETRAPRDIDVVTFYHLPSGVTQQELLTNHAALVDESTLKALYKVDAYIVNLGIHPQRLARQSAYWYSMWSHRRNDQWKGFLQVDLAPTDDAVATETLAAQVTTAQTQGGQP